MLKKKNLEIILNNKDNKDTFIKNLILLNLLIIIQREKKDKK